MEPIFDWIANHLQVFGFLVAAAIFLFTSFLVSKRYIGFFVTLLFLLFALLAGFTIANQDAIRAYLEKEPNDQSALLQKFDNIQSEIQKQADEIEQLIKDKSPN